MSNDLKIEDVDDDFTVLDEIMASEEIDLTYDDEDEDISDSIDIKQEKLDAPILSTVSEEEGYLNSDNEEEKNKIEEQPNNLNVENEKSENPPNSLGQSGKENEEIPDKVSQAIDQNEDENNANNIESNTSAEQNHEEAIIQDDKDLSANSTVLDNVAAVLDKSNVFSEVTDGILTSNQLLQIDEKEETEENVSHPYVYLIDTFEYPHGQLNLTTVGSVKTLEETLFFMVQTKGALMNMLQKLRSATEIGLDTFVTTNEFTSTVCWIMISTKEADYCIDAIKMKHEVLLLTEIFINPKIVKVLLVAKKTLTHLRKKLHLYVVNAFDIEAATTTLNLMKRGLCAILKREFNYERVFVQNTDFRRRPLPDNYITFLRTGSHYLIYIYHNYKNKMLIKDPELYKQFLDHCRNVCKEMPPNISKVTFQALEEKLKNHHSCELEVLRKLFDWRNRLGQKNNVKAELICNNDVLIRLAKNLPISDDEICELANVKYVRDTIQEIKNLIVETKFKHQLIGKKGFRKFRRVRSNQIDSYKKGSNRLHEAYNEFKLSLQLADNHNNKRVKLNSPPTHQNKSFGSPWKQKNSNFNTGGQKRNNRNRQPGERNSSFFNKSASQANNNFVVNPSNAMNHQSPDIFSNTPNQINNFSMNPNAMMLTPTNIPSPFTFQTNSSMNANSDGYFGQTPSSSNTFIPFNQNSNDVGRQMDTIGSNPDVYKALVDLKQVRDNLQMQAMKGSNFGGNRLQDLNDINQKINMLESRIQPSHGSDHRERRRYYKN